MIDTDRSVAGDVVLGKDSSIGLYTILGYEPAQLPPTRIGDRAMIRSHAVVYRGTTIGRDFQAGHSALIREQTTIGDSVSVGSHTIIEHHVTIGDHVRLHSGCFVPEHSVLEDGAWLGPRVIVTNAKYPNRPDTKQNLQGVLVKRGAVIGAGAVLLPGAVIGAGALVGAGAVVVADVPDGARVAGNPARLLT